jgi:hypothetical protein
MRGSDEVIPWRIFCVRESISLLLRRVNEILCEQLHRGLTQNFVTTTSLAKKIRQRKTVSSFQLYARNLRRFVDHEY